MSTDLTARQYEVASQYLHANAGDVARSLGISIRTVENTIDRVYKKIGVKNREGLAAYFDTLCPNCHTPQDYQTEMPGLSARWHCWTCNLHRRAS